MSGQTDTIAGRVHNIGTEAVVSAVRVPTSVSSSRPTWQIDREAMEQLGLQNLADAVKRMAGASVKDYGGMGGLKTVSIRNLGAHHTAVSYDGVTISNIQAGQIDIGRYTLDGIESVALSVGEADDWLQSARHYASAGVLSIKSRRQGPDGSPLEVKVKGGSFGLISPSLRYWQPLGRRTTIAANAAYMHADGVYPFILKNGIERTHERRNNSDIDSWQGEANLYHTLADSSRLDMKLYWYRSRRGLPGAVVLYNRRSTERMWDEDFFAQALYTRQINKWLSLQSRLKYSHAWNRYQDTDVKYEGGRRTDVARQNEYYLSATLGWQPTRSLRFSLAEDVAIGNLRSNITISDNLTDPPYPRRTTSLTAIAARYSHGPFTINADVVGTYATEHVKAGTQPADRHRLSPSVAASMRITDTNPLYLRLMYKSTFRMPTFNDLYYIRMGNTGLRPENAHEWGAGLSWSTRLPHVVRHLSITADAYLNHVTDKIVAFPTTYVWKMSNYGKVRIHGIDFTLAAETPLLPATARMSETSLTLTAAYTMQRAIDRDPRSATYNNQLPYTPRHSGNIAAMLRTPWVNVGYSIVMQGRRWSSSQTIKQYELKAYDEHTLSLSRDLRLRHSTIGLQATINNLTNRQYDIIQYYPMPGRSFTMAATLKL
ncbi:MAG: TonB-dependent receptor [Bacteroidaceae bacterium]|nr:TonB-dependent receptor [Bacteroidaceae bacterium]